MYSGKSSPSTQHRKNSRIACPLPVLPRPLYDVRVWVIGQSSMPRSAHSRFHPRLPLPPDAEPWYDPGPTRVEEPRQTRKPAKDGHYRHTRRVAGGAVQSRIWINRNKPLKGFSLNLGLSLLRDNDFNDDLTEWSAAKVSREFRKRWKPGCTIGSVVAEMQRAGLIKLTVVVPEFAAGLTPSAGDGPSEYASERRDRERAEQREERRRLREEWECRRYGGTCWPLLRLIGIGL